MQIDVKYITNEFIGFASYHSRYFQLTAIDEYSRKKYLKLVNELSTYSTSNFLKRLEDKLGFKVELLQTDNGIEFVNDLDITNKNTKFEKYLKKTRYKTQAYPTIYTMAKRNSRTKSQNR